MPTAGGLLRRRWLITTSKFLLPATAILLLASIALWPEFRANHATKRASSLHGLRADPRMCARVTERPLQRRRRAPWPAIHGHGGDARPQRSEDQIDLTVPNADMTLENGSWINVKSKQGVYMRKAQQLDLSDDVVLYRDDGTTMTTSSASVDVKNGAASSAAPTHVEGPFGSTGRYRIHDAVDKGAAIQFWGPVHVHVERRC